MSMHKQNYHGASMVTINRVRISHSTYQRQECCTNDVHLLFIHKDRATIEQITAINMPR